MEARGCVRVVVPVPPPQSILRPPALGPGQHSGIEIDLKRRAQRTKGSLGAVDEVVVGYDDRLDVSLLQAANKKQLLAEPHVIVRGVGLLQSSAPRGEDLDGVPDEDHVLGLEDEVLIDLGKMLRHVLKEENALALQWPHHDPPHHFVAIIDLCGQHLLPVRPEGIWADVSEVMSIERLVHHLGVAPLSEGVHQARRGASRR
mmetsp:Transcript_3225/g.10921  ORF Transcript_3225/g.10921 Transcript_3225/m.10921 type:complete len:202 (-) Transcript_3225:154-759(-)